MTNKQKNIIFPLLTVGTVGVIGMFTAKMPLISVALPIAVIIPTVINIIKRNSTGKLFLDGFIVAGIYMAAVLILAFLARENATAMAILHFPFHNT